MPTANANVSMASYEKKHFLVKGRSGHISKSLTCETERLEIFWPGYLQRLRKRDFHSLVALFLQEVLLT